MDFGQFIDGATGYFQGHPLIGAGIVLALILFVYFRIKLAFKLAAAAAILVAVLYVFMFLIHLTETGIHEQDKFLDNPHIKNM